MNWFQGNIAEAVQQSKEKNAIFVVYVEGNDESTQKLNRFLNDESVSVKLDSDDFVAIKIESDSAAYIQFATIYKVVPVPSIFFIGKSGAPLEVATGVIASAKELEKKINNVLQLAGVGKGTQQDAATNDEQPQTSTSTVAPVDKQLSAELETEEVVCEGAVCYKKPSNTALQNSQVSAANSTETEEIEKKRLEESRKLLEEQRRERVQQENQLEKERELARRQDGKNVQNLQQWQKENELKELKDNLRREKLEEQALRERIKAQIAGDRAERAQKTAAEAKKIEDNAAVDGAKNEATPNRVNAGDTTRLQFRFANGDIKTNVFKCSDHLSVVREYVRIELLPGTGISDFTLATIYPKRELRTEHETQTLIELGLFPSAVLLVIGKMRTTPTSIIMQSGGIVNALTTVVWTLFITPVVAIFGFFSKYFSGIRAKNDANAVGAQKRASEDENVQQDAAKRRNLDRLGGPSTSRDASNPDGDTGIEASSELPQQPQPYRRYGGSNVHRLSDNRKEDDDNATWNGNSTQQQ